MHPPVCLLVDLSTRKRPVVVFAHSTRLSWSRWSRTRERGLKCSANDFAVKTFDWLLD